MSAELLHRAAAKIRDEYMPGAEHAVAGLLDHLADENGDLCDPDHPAVTVAYAYLGETA